MPLPDSLPAPRSLSVIFIRINLVSDSTGKTHVTTLWGLLRVSSTLWWCKAKLESFQGASILFSPEKLRPWRNFSCVLVRSLSESRWKQLHNRSLKITRLRETAQSDFFYPSTHQDMCNERNCYEIKCSRKVRNTGYLAFHSFCSEDGVSPKLQPADMGSVPLGCAVSTSYPCQFLLGWQWWTNIRERTKLSPDRRKALMVIDSHLHHNGMLLNHTEGNSLHLSSLCWETITNLAFILSKYPILPHLFSVTLFFPLLLEQASKWSIQCLSVTNSF